MGRLCLPNLKAYYMVIVTKTVWCWQRNRHMDQWSTAENPDNTEPMHKYAS